MESKLKSNSSLRDFIKTNELSKNNTKVRLGDYTYIKARIGWRGLSSSEYTQNGPYLIAGQHIKGSKIKWDKCDHISDFRYNESPEIQLKNSDVIISKDGTIGRVGYIENMPNKATINGTMMLIRSNDSDLLDPKFLYFYLQGPSFQKIIKEKISGSSVPHIFQRDMVSLTIPLIRINDQRRIATIISTVDASIEATDTIIAQTKKIKKSIMQNQFSKDVNKNIVQLGLYTYIKARIGWRGLSASEYTSEGPYLIAGQHIIGSGIGWINCDHISEYRYNESPEIQLKIGDIIISKDGTIGRVGYIRTLPGKATINGTMMLIRSNDSNVFYPQYLYYYFQSEAFRRLVSEKISGSSIPHIFQRDITKLKIPLISIEEQKRTVKLLSIIDDKLENELLLKSKLANLKKALMQVLLTGNVRVKVDTDAQP